ncbi:MAG: response regulator [Jatrophihabitans sp.]|uniref:response regulator n=1 Tax=Jatrophihabitans sp. TaxID=1932789 RepID=UPI003F7EB2B9
MIRVLVVDDDFRVADLHAEFVRRVPGFDVVGVAHTGAAALDAARVHRPDLVLLDLYLPDEHGLSVLRRLREGEGHNPDVIVISAARDVASVRAAMQGGVVQYLVKPFAFRAFADRLTAYRALHEQAHRTGEVAQRDVDRLFSIMRGPAGAAELPKGLSEPTMALVRAQFEDSAAELSAAGVAERIGISRATAQRYLAVLVHDGRLELTLKYGTAGRPEHRYRQPRRTPP